MMTFAAGLEGAHDLFTLLLVIFSHRAIVNPECPTPRRVVAPPRDFQVNILYFFLAERSESKQCETRAHRILFFSNLTDCTVP
jgi:hypothetical protein